MKKTNLEGVKTTNLKRVKKVAKQLVDLPIECDNKFGIIQHPFISNRFVPKILEPEDVGKVIPYYDVYDEKDLKEVRSMLKKTIDMTRDYQHFSIIVNKPYLLTFFKYTKDFLSNEDYSKFLSIAWTYTEYPNSDANVSTRELIYYFKKADKNILMSKDELEAYNKLDSVIDVYRGVKPGAKVRALSWTTDKKVARWFADRYEKNGKVYKGIIYKQDIFAYFLNRNEYEVVINHSKLIKVKEIHYD